MSSSTSSPSAPLPRPGSRPPIGGTRPPNRPLSLPRPEGIRGATWSVLSIRSYHRPAADGGSPPRSPARRPQDDRTSGQQSRALSSEGGRGTTCCPVVLWSFCRPARPRQSRGGAGIPLFFLPFPPAFCYNPHHPRGIPPHTHPDGEIRHAASDTTTEPLCESD